MYLCQISGKGQGITFPPAAVKATELLLVALGDQFLCLSGAGWGPALKSPHVGAAWVGGSR